MCWHRCLLCGASINPSFDSWCLCLNKTISKGCGELPAMAGAVRVTLIDVKFEFVLGNEAEGRVKLPFISPWASSP